jgi:hypothetical protein
LGNGCGARASGGGRSGAPLRAPGLPGTDLDFDRQGRRTKFLILIVSCTQPVPNGRAPGQGLAALLTSS